MDFNKDYETKSLSEIVILYVKDKLLSGALKSRDRILELDIARELKISRAPVREATRELQILGIITLEKRKGCYITDIGKNDFTEIFDIRTALENDILRLLINNNLITKNDFDNLYNIIDEMRIRSQGDYDKFTKLYYLNSLDIAFHNYLWDLSKSYRRKAILESLFYQLLAVMNYDVNSLGSFKDKINEHTKILEVLKEGDIPLIEKIFKEHMEAYIISSLNIYV